MTPDIREPLCEPPFIGRLGARLVEKPWGSTALAPWTTLNPNKAAIGELWFQLPGDRVSDTQLLLKLLFTSQPLSIQVHPSDSYARSLGLAQGKSEAWVILAAAPEAQAAIGLTQRLNEGELRDAIMDGSIANLVKWRPVAKDDFIFIPAGTIHALGAGVVVAEVQQTSDATFRLFDFGRGRRLDVDNAVAAACKAPADHPPNPIRLDDVRTLLVASEHFTLERIALAPASSWELAAEKESWIFALGGDARFGEIALKTGEAMFAERALVPVAVGAEGFACLMAYADCLPRFNLLRQIDPTGTAQ